MSLKRTRGCILAVYPPIKPPTPHKGSLEPWAARVGAQFESGEVILLPLPKRKRSDAEKAISRPLDIPMVEDFLPLVAP